MLHEYWNIDLYFIPMAISTNQVCYYKATWLGKMTPLFQITNMQNMFC